MSHFNSPTFCSRRRIINIFLSSWYNGGNECWETAELNEMNHWESLVWMVRKPTVHLFVRVSPWRIVHPDNHSLGHDGTMHDSCHHFCLWLVHCRHPPDQNHSFMRCLRKQKWVLTLSLSLPLYIRATASPCKIQKLRRKGTFVPHSGIIGFLKEACIWITVWFNLS